MHPSHNKGWRNRQYITHLNNLPKNGVVHLKGDKIYSIKEFKESHKRDHHELMRQKESKH
jgi:hypothetical protein